MEPEAADGVGLVSKAEILRLVISDRLSAAAQEIFAVVERTLAGYEEEVSGWRQELDLQRSQQLEALLQPPVKVERPDDDEYMIPISEPIPEEASEGGAGDEVGGGGEDGLHAEEEEEQQQQKFEMSMEDDGSMALLCYTGVETHDEEEEEEEEEEEQEEEEELVLTPIEEQDQISELDYEEASRSPPTVQPERRSVGRPRLHVDLKICIVEDSAIEVLSPKVFKECTRRELRCPCGLREPDFLVLLRSTFPQLAANQPFDIFWSDRTRLLRPLTVTTLTPEQICSAIKSNGLGNSSLYIRLKPLPVPKKTRRSVAHSSTKSLHLRICILDDPKMKVILPVAFRKWPMRELKCPRGLQQDEFLDLLRSTYPVLLGNKPFDFFTIDKNRTLRPLVAAPLTPETIVKTIKSIGAGKSALYIRLKHFDKQMRLARPPQRENAAAENAPRPNTSAQSEKRKPGRPRTRDTQYVDLSLRVLEDPKVNVLSAGVFRKYPLQELKCPCGLQEPDFMDLLRSTFPQLAGDKPFDILTSDRSRTLYPLKMENMTPEGVSRTLRSLKHSGIYIRLKAPEKKRNTAAAQDSPSTSVWGRHGVIPKYTEAAYDDDDDGDGDEEHEWFETPSLWSLPLSETDQEEEEGDADWRAAKTDENLKNKKPEKRRRKRKRQQGDDSGVQRKKRKRVRSSHLQVLTGRNNNGPLACRVCGITRRSTRMLIKHSWRHVDDEDAEAAAAAWLCGVCGEQSPSAELLRVHLQSHQKTHSCDICGKSLLSSSGLSGHLARHRGEKPHKCKVCHKAFAEKWTLKSHMWIHYKDKPHKCDLCPKSYMSKQKLRLHRAKHEESGTRAEEKPHSCSTCNASFATSQTLSKHMLTHSSSSEEKPYACDICDKRYALNKRLQSHLRKHTSQWPNGCSTCNKPFACKAKLVMHMRNHTS